MNKETNKHMDDTVDYSYTDYQIRQYMLGGLKVAGFCFFTSTSTLENSIALMGTKSSTPTL